MEKSIERIEEKGKDRTAEETKDEIYVKVEVKFEEIFKELVEEHELDKGDITPLQNEKLETLKQETKELVKNWFKQNYER